MVLTEEALLFYINNKELTFVGVIPLTTSSIMGSGFAASSWSLTLSSTAEIQKQNRSDCMHSDLEHFLDKLL